MSPWWGSDAGFQSLVLLVVLYSGVSIVEQALKQLGITWWKALFSPPNEHDSIYEKREHGGSDDGDNCA
jgi:hypothetical protein